jgi:thiosulfate/3-mercaptopyruvate sulfurtransferase
VSPAWLKDHLAGGGVKVLDGTWYMPNAGKDPLAEFMEDRIPGEETRA